MFCWNVNMVCSLRHSGFADTVTANIWSWRQSWFSSTVHLLGLQSYSATETRLFTSSSKRPSSTAPYGVLTIGFFQSACRLALEMADEKKSSSPFCSSHEGKMKAVKNTFFFLFFFAVNLLRERSGQVIQWHFSIQAGAEHFWGDDLIFPNKFKVVSALKLHSGIYHHIILVA